jgi:glycosyltransferase involved in cell wall biosynthesis
MKPPTGSRRWRILQFVAGLDIEGLGGGIGRFGFELCPALDPARFDVTLCSLWDFGSPGEPVRRAQLAAAGVRSFAAAPWDPQAPYRSFWAAYRGIQRQLAGAQFDLLHSHYEFSDLIALLLKRGLHSRRVVRTAHNYEWPRRPLRRLSFSHLLYPLAFDRELAVSQALADRLNARPLARLTRRQAQVIPNAINLERFRNAALQTPRDAHAERPPVVGSVGRLVPQKGWEVLLRAAALVLAQRPEVSFIIIGEGELMEKLGALARSLGLAQQVQFAGRQEHIEQAYAQFDLFVSTALWEGLPSVVLESMACGVPVVATDIPGVRTLVQDGLTGRLTPPNDPAATAAAILDLLADPAARARLAQQAQSVPARFNIATIARQYAQVYLELLD